jgi:hypothetical protein
MASLWCIYNLLIETGKRRGKDKGKDDFPQASKMAQDARQAL